MDTGAAANRPAQQCGGCPAGSCPTALRRRGAPMPSRRKRQTKTRPPAPPPSAPATAPSTPPESYFPGLEPTSRELAVVGAALGALCLTVYGFTLCPTVAGGDSGELTTAAYTLTVAHPPGYPLWTLLGKLFTLIPYGSIAWRVNLLSAVCDAGAALLLFLAVARWTRNTWSAFLAAGLFAFSPLVWRYALVAEVFALNNLFVSALLYLAVLYWEQRRPWTAPTRLHRYT